MPTYEYQCTACSHRFELFQSMKDPALKKCPNCGKLRLERLIGTGAAILFKGSGFYQTDYRSESYKKAADADSKPDASKSAPAAEKNEPGTTKAEKPAPEVAAKPVNPSRAKSKKPKP